MICPKKRRRIGQIVSKFFEKGGYKVAFYCNIEKPDP